MVRPSSVSYWRSRKNDLQPSLLICHHFFYFNCVFSLFPHFSTLPRRLLSSSMMKSNKSFYLIFFLFGVSSAMVATNIKGTAAKPYDKKRVVVVGAGGYLGGCIYGFLQRASSLYGTGIQSTQGSPRAITATAIGSVALNKVLGMNFILAQADESFVKLTDMSSLDAIEERVKGFDAAILATRCTLEKRPVTLGSYEKSPNDKTYEFYFEKPKSKNIIANDDKDLAMEMFINSLEACREGGIKRVVVVETDGQFDGVDDSSSPHEKYLDVLKKCGISYTYIQLDGKLENSRSDYTFAMGIQGNLQLELVDDLSYSKESSNSIYREDLAAVCVQVWFF